MKKIQNNSPEIIQNIARNQFLYEHPETGIQLWIKRLDELEPRGIGNKIFKLKYNMEEARHQNLDTILTFGGAFSNHIAATASVCKSYGLKSIGIIRGGELQKNLIQTLSENPTLSEAVNNGMRLRFISREAYRQKDSPEFLQELSHEFGAIYLLPEGGTNSLAIQGTSEMLTPDDRQFDYITCAVGTGGTIRGIIKAAKDDQIVLGYAALKADLTHEIEKYTEKKNWKIFPENEFGGYAKINAELVSFINRFALEYQVPLDPIYNAKMMFKIFQQIKYEEFRENSRILAIHTGGLQGVAGMNNQLRKKNLPLIKF